MLCNTFVPHLLATCLPLETQWFMQDGARLHTANVVLDFLHDTSYSFVISNRFLDIFACGLDWPPNSPDLNPCDYFLWGFLKEKIFPKKTANKYGIGNTNHSGLQRDEDICRRVINIITVRVEEVARRNGGHIEHFIYRG
jgi:hypothetical protein